MFRTCLEHMVVSVEGENATVQLSDIKAPLLSNKITDNPDVSVNIERYANVTTDFLPFGFTFFVSFVAQLPNSPACIQKVEVVYGKMYSVCICSCAQCSLQQHVYTVMLC